MASLVLTLENRQKSLKIVGDVVLGWEKNGFRGRGSMDYVNDTRLRVLLDILPPKKWASSVAVFPKEIQQERWGDNSLSYSLNYPKIEVFADLESNMGTLLSSGKPGFVQGNIPVAKLWLKLTVHIEAPRRESSITWEYDVLPFLPGGQSESKRSRH